MQQKKNTFNNRWHLKNLTSTAIELVHLVTNPTVIASSSIKGNFSRSIFQIAVHSCSSSNEQTDLSDKLKKKKKVKVSLNSVCLAQVSFEQNLNTNPRQALVNNELETFCFSFSLRRLVSLKTAILRCQNKLNQNFLEKNTSDNNP